MVHRTRTRRLPPCSPRVQSRPLSCCAAARPANSTVSQGYPSSASLILLFRAVSVRVATERAVGWRLACVPRILDHPRKPQKPPKMPTKINVMKSQRRSCGGAADARGGLVKSELWSVSPRCEAFWMPSSTAGPFLGIGGTLRFLRTARGVAFLDLARRLGKLFRDLAQELRRALLRFRSHVFFHKSLQTGKFLVHPFPKILEVFHALDPRHFVIDAFSEIFVSSHGRLYPPRHSARFLYYRNAFCGSQGG